VGPCRGFEGDCGDLATQFASLPVMPGFPDGLAGWTCDAFPNDENPRDSLIVALIALAVALPVTLFLNSAFALANDGEQPESWLAWSGTVRVLLGRSANREWAYCRGAQPTRFIRWWIRSKDAPAMETLMNLAHSARCALTCREPDWAREAREAADAAAAGRHYMRHKRYGSKRQSSLRLSQRFSAVSKKCDEQAVAQSPRAPRTSENGTRVSEDGLVRRYATLESDFIADIDVPGDDDDDAASQDGWGAGDEADELSTYKRFCAASGILGTAITWAAFAWFILTCAFSLTLAHCLGSSLTHVFPRADGILIYQLLGADAESSFARSFGVSYGVGAAAEWKEVAKDAAIAAAVLLLLERLHITRPVSWLEQQVDYLSLQALVRAALQCACLRTLLTRCTRHARSSTTTRRDARRRLCRSRSASSSPTRAGWREMPKPQAAPPALSPPLLRKCLPLPSAPPPPARCSCPRRRRAAARPARWYSKDYLGEQLKCSLRGRSVLLDVARIYYTALHNAGTDVHRAALSAVERTRDPARKTVSRSPRHVHRASTSRLGLEGVATAVCEGHVEDARVRKCS
jgi:hypothetical protein